MSEPKKEESGFWAIVELMGHRKLGAYVSEQTFAGAPMLRVDVPETSVGKGFTQFYSGGAIYCITPCEESVARSLAEYVREKPVQQYELRQLEAANQEPDFVVDEHDYEKPF